VRQPILEPCENLVGYSAAANAVGQRAVHRHMEPSQETIAAIVARLKDVPGALLPILHAIQDEFGYVSAAAVPVIADGLNLSRAEVHGVISFYHYFRDTPPGRHTIHLCRAEACQAMNQRAVEQHAKARLGVDFHQTTGDGVFTFEPVYCLGNCACGPSMLVDGELYGRVTPERFDTIAAEWERR
jgi:formate dehydrogenase subunit gamma